ncbi:hypothetical protein GcC1_c17873o13 [Golovinomyces cichoracearum]|uniref:Uncharacterized protein n=1 Tax=Golovinomyces cichoracearum TaxID=62708 RepID=A0A420ISX1_9PEZI|nr:hypothetical protein GcC1_c17873o13 [Golovinomyces cichoracearum]
MHSLCFRFILLWILMTPNFKAFRSDPIQRSPHTVLHLSHSDMRRTYRPMLRAVFKLVTGTEGEA